MRRSMELLSVLLVAMLAVWTPPAAEALFPWTTVCRGEARWPCLRRPRIAHNPPPKALPPPPGVKECLGPIRHVNGCGHSLFRSDASGKLRVEGECCSAVRSMEEHCFDAVFTSFNFGSAFAQKLKEHCAPTATDGRLAPHV